MLNISARCTKSSIDQDSQSPCGNPILGKIFKAKDVASWDILEKEVVDEIIFKKENLRNRLMLKLMARGGMRVGEALQLTSRDV
jgi:integrase/recombinase XerD